LKSSVTSDDRIEMKPKIVEVDEKTNHKE